MSSRSVRRDNINLTGRAHSIEAQHSTLLSSVNSREDMEYMPARNREFFATVTEAKAHEFILER